MAKFMATGWFDKFIYIYLSPLRRAWITSLLGWNWTISKFNFEETKFRSLLAYWGSPIGYLLHMFNHEVGHMTEIG